MESRVIDASRKVYDKNILWFYNDLFIGQVERSSK